jgi:hypothetical protein
VIDVEQRGLRALEQDRVPVGDVPVQDQRDVADARAQPLAEGHEVVPQPREVDLGRDAQAAAELLVMLARLLQLPGQAVGPQQVARAQAAPRHLVFVRGSDAAQGGPDLARPARGLRHLLQQLVVRQDEVRAVGDDEVVVHRHAADAQLRHLLLELPGVDHHPRPDDAQDAGVEDAAGNEAQDEALVADDHRVAGVVAAVVARHHLHLLGEQVDDLAFALVAPLGARDHYVWHLCARKDRPFYILGGGTRGNESRRVALGGLPPLRGFAPEPPRGGTRGNESRRVALGGLPPLRGFAPEPPRGGTRGNESRRGLTAGCPAVPVLL